jgi:hypothetical protein
VNGRRECAPLHMASAQVAIQWQGRKQQRQENDMRKQFFIPVLVVILALATTQAFAQSATVVMRNGDRVRAEVMDMGANFTFRINGQDQQVPINDVVLIDFAGNGRNISPDELAKANEASGNGMVVMRNGDTFTSRLLDITGIPSRGMFSGDRQINLSDISRIYLGSVRNIPDIAANSESAVGAPPSAPGAPPWARGRGRGNRDQNRDAQRTDAPQGAQSVVVPGNVQWTNTGMRVTKGQWLRFEPSGEIRLSFNENDVAVPAGAKSARTVAKSQIPSIYVGALIGRVNNSRPFSIGDTTQAFQMPADGILFLGVNDDHSPDNSGNYVVRVWEP